MSEKLEVGFRGTFGRRGHSPFPPHPLSHNIAFNFYSAHCAERVGGKHCLKIEIRAEFQLCTFDDELNAVVISESFAVQAEVIVCGVRP